MKIIRHAQIWPLVMGALFTPTVLAHSQGEIGGSFLTGLLHQLSSWHHLAGLLAFLVAACILTGRQLRKTRTRQRRRNL